MRKLWAMGLASLLAVSGCGVAGLSPLSSGDRPIEARAVETLDRDAYLRQSAEVLAQLLREGDRASVQRFLDYAHGPDPDPAGTRQIAQRALSGLDEASGGLHSQVARVAQGQVSPKAQIEAKEIRFPQDEGMHPSSITEWWYLNGHLQVAGVPRYGYEFTLFKVGPLLHWAHVALTDQRGDRFHYVREGFLPSKVSERTDRLANRYGAHVLEADGDSYRLVGVAGDARFDLRLSPEKAPLLINGNGKIDMPEGKDSWYYSQTRLRAQGSVTLAGATQPVSGLSWLDHQWGPFYVSGLRERWDWFALQFDDGTEYNLFGFRDAKGKALNRYVNQALPSGRGKVNRHFELERLAWWHSPLTKLFFTTAWRITIPETGEVFRVEATNQNQEVARNVPFYRDPLPNYWEGSMRAVKVLPDGREIKGVGYCEHFGLPKPTGTR